jgi:hypothetical protein
MMRRNWRNVTIAMGLASSLGFAFIAVAWVLGMFETKTGVLIYGIASGVGQFVLGIWTGTRFPTRKK